MLPSATCQSVAFPSLRCLLVQRPHLGPPAGCPGLPAPCPGPGPSLCGLPSRSLSRRRLPPNQPTRASFCSVISVSGRPAQPGPPACFAHPFEALTGGQGSWPGARGWGWCQSLAATSRRAGSLDPAFLGPMYTGQKCPDVRLTGMDIHPGLPAGPFPQPRVLSHGSPMVKLSAQPAAFGPIEEDCGRKGLAAF